MKRICFLFTALLVVMAFVISSMADINGFDFAAKNEALKLTWSFPDTVTSDVIRLGNRWSELQFNYMTENNSAAVYIDAEVSPDKINWIKLTDQITMNNGDANDLNGFVKSSGIASSRFLRVKMQSSGTGTATGWFTIGGMK